MKACVADKTYYSLPRNQVPEWSASYIDYKGLKKLIKSASRAQQAGEEVDLAGGHAPLKRTTRPKRHILRAFSNPTRQNSSSRWIAISKMSTPSIIRSSQRLIVGSSCSRIDMVGVPMSSLTWTNMR